MWQFLQEWGLEILFALSTAGALGFCKYLNKQRKEYKTLLEAREDTEVDQAIEKKLEPIHQELEELRAYVRDTEIKSEKQLQLIISSYKYRLVQLCKIHLAAGEITTEEFEQLSEFYKLYAGLGGNGQAKEYYEKTLKLPIQD